MRIKVYDVFAGRLFEGNPTAIIYWEGMIDRELMQKIASELQVPDSIFIYDIFSTGDILFNSITFSPFEELSICGQGMIGAFNALHEEQPFHEGSYHLGTAAGRRKIIWAEETASVSLGVPYQVTDPDVDAIATCLQDIINIPDIIRMGIIDLTRKRLIVEVDINYMPYLHPSTELILNSCAALQLSGIAFFSRIRKQEVRSRYFTTSLNGAEDAVTGGASAAILSFINSHEPHLPELLVNQGNFATRGGQIFVSKHPGEQEVFVGGKCGKFSDGQLFLPL